jgi:hypothetical protein
VKLGHNPIWPTFDLHPKTSKPAVPPRRYSPDSTVPFLTVSIINSSFIYLVVVYYYKVTVLPAILRSSCHFLSAFTTSLPCVAFMKGIYLLLDSEGQGSSFEMSCSTAEGGKVILSRTCESANL